MRASLRFFILVLIIQTRLVRGFTEQFCDKLCIYSDTVCWFCKAFNFNEEENEDAREKKDDPLSKSPVLPGLVMKSQLIMNRQQKIIGGYPLQYGDAPWTASIKYRDGKVFFTYCGGTIISEKFVLTAAHCLRYQDPEDLFVGLGDHDRNQDDSEEILSAVLRIITHPKFRSLTYEADVGLLELAQTIRFDQYKQPAALARPGLDLNGLTFNVTGWGVVKEQGSYAQKLMQVEVPYVPFAKCQKAYNAVKIAPKIRKGMICAGFAAGKYDACQGDSGGPLVAMLPPSDLDNVLFTNIDADAVNFNQDELEKILLSPRQNQMLPRFLWANLQKLFAETEKQEIKDILSGAANLQAALLSQIIQQEMFSTNSAAASLLSSLTPPQIIDLGRRISHTVNGRIPTLVGVVSWGMGCGRPRYVGVYTDVRVYRDWIIEQIGGEPNHIWKI